MLPVRYYSTHSFTRRDIVVHKLKARHRSDHLVPKRFNENSFQFKVVPSGFSTVK